MTNVKIGNDIRIQTSISELGIYDQTNIKQLKCYIVRTTETQYVDEINPGYPQYYTPTEYDICLSGIPRYNYPMPYNTYAFNNAQYCPANDYHLFPSYNGFGTCSKQFKFGPTDYIAPSRVLYGQNMIECYFPAQDQIKLGTYKLVIVITVYTPGWNYNNFRTYTLDKGDIFNLVDDTTGQSGEIVINTNSITPTGVSSNSILYLPALQSISINDIDAIGTQYKIDVIYSDNSIKTWTSSTNITLSTNAPSDIIKFDTTTGKITSLTNVTEQKSYTITITGTSFTSTITINIMPDIPIIYNIIKGSSITNTNSTYKYGVIASSSAYTLAGNKIPTSVSIMINGVDKTSQFYNSTSYQISIPCLYYNNSVNITIADE